MKVEEIMTKDPVAVDATATVAEVAKQMRDKDVGCVVVLRDGKVAGICNDRQLVTDAMAEGLDPTEAEVQDVMTDAPGRLTPDDDMFEAIDTLRSAGVVRRAPVVNAYEELVGIVSISDIAVVADRLNKAMMLELTHNALDEARVLTGGKRIQKRMRRPGKQDRLPPDVPTHTTTEPTPDGPPTKRGNAPKATRTS